MAQQSPLARLATSSREYKQRCLEYLNAHANYVGAAERQLTGAHSAMKHALSEHKTQVLMVFEENSLVVASVEEIEALMEALRSNNLTHRLLAVSVAGPVPLVGQAVHPNVAVLRATLEHHNFVFHQGNTYFLPNQYIGTAADAAAAAAQNPLGPVAADLEVAGPSAPQELSRKSFAD